MAEFTVSEESEYAIFQLPSDEYRLRAERVEETLLATKADLNRTNTIIVELTTDKVELEEQRDRARIQVERYKRKLSAVEADIEMNKDEICALRMDNDSLRKELDKRGRASNRLQIRLDKQIKLFDEADADFEAIRAREKDLVSQVQSYADQERIWEKRLRSSDERYKSLHAECERLLEENTCLQSAEQTARQECNRFETELSALRADHVKLALEMQVDLANLQQQQMLINEDLSRVWEGSQRPTQVSEASPNKPIRLSDELSNFQTLSKTGSYIFDSGQRDFSIEIISNNGQDSHGSETTQTSSVQSIPKMAVDSNSSVSVKSTTDASQDLGADLIGGSPVLLSPEWKRVEPSYDLVQKRYHIRKKPDPLPLHESVTGKPDKQHVPVRRPASDCIKAMMSPPRFTLSPQQITPRLLGSQETTNEKATTRVPLVDQYDCIDAEHPKCMGNRAKLIDEDGHKIDHSPSDTSARRSLSSLFSLGLSGKFDEMIKLWQSGPIRSIDKPRPLKLNHTSDQREDADAFKRKSVTLMPAPAKPRRQMFVRNLRLVRSLSDFGQDTSYRRYTTESRAKDCESSATEHEAMIGENIVVLSSPQMFGQVLPIICLVIVLIGLMYNERNSHDWYSANQRTYRKVVDWRDEVFGSHLMDQARWLVENRWIRESPIMV